MRTVAYRSGTRADKRGGRRLLRWSLAVLGALAGLFILANLVTMFLYRDKVLPNYSVGAVPVGGAPLDQLDRRLPVEKLLPATVVFRKDDITKQFTPRELGVTVDAAATRERLKHVRSWLPLTALFMHRTVPAELEIDTIGFSAAAQKLQADFTKTPLPERIIFSGQDFTTAAPEAGYAPDMTGLRARLATLLERGATDLKVPTAAVNASEPTGKLGGELERLQRQLSAKITLTAGGKSHQLGRDQIGRFFESAGQTMQLSTAKINIVIGEVASVLGIQPVNQSEAVSAAQYALAKSQPVTFVLAGSGTKVYRYCAAVKGGVSASVLPEFRQKLAAVYGDPHGWNQGDVTLIYAESGCDYTAWLSAASSMTSFGGVCDNYYSCRSGPNVVVNYDRWQGATDPWNAAHGSLEDYRVMVINHETGHWLGFAHRHCAAPGQLAPVMQQQSIDLEGCTFNPWPTPAEISTLR